MKASSGVLIIAGVFFTVWCGVVAFRWVTNPTGRQNFDPKRWAKGGITDNCDRYEMVDDLIVKHARKGAKRESVIAMLGTPIREEPAKGYYEMPSGVRVDEYRLGSCSGFRMDSDYLAIVYDSENRVVKAWAWQS